jgi:hypothetical protein
VTFRGFLSRNRLCHATHHLGLSLRNATAVVSLALALVPSEPLQVLQATAARQSATPACPALGTADTLPLPTLRGWNEPLSTLRAPTARRHGDSVGQSILTGRLLGSWTRLHSRPGGTHAHAPICGHVDHEVTAGWITNW